MKQLRSNGHVSFSRQAFGHISNVGVHPKGFLQNNHARVPFLLRARHISRHLGSVGYLQFHFFADNCLLHPHSYEVNCKISIFRRNL